MDSFREYLDSPARLRCTLMPTGIAPGAELRYRTAPLPLVPVWHYSIMHIIYFMQATIWWAGQLDEDAVGCG